jgi:ATP-dependent helicase/nuclease subunit A
MSSSMEARHQRILASAGTGKTYQLTSRYLQLVLEGADPRTILATTFTRAAAAEIRTRILGTAARALIDDDKRIELAGRTGRPDLSPAELERLLQLLVTNLLGLQIKTIDSTFAGIAGAAAPELGLPDGLGILESDEQAGLEHRALALALEGATEAGRDESFLGALDALGKGGGAGRSIVQLFHSIIDKSLMTYHDAGGDPAPWRWRVALDEAPLDLMALVDRLQGHAATREASIGKRDVLCKAILKLAEGLEVLSADHPAGELVLDDWEKLFNSGIANKVLKGEATFNRCEIDSELRSLVAPLVDRMHATALVDYAGRTQSTYYLLHLYAEARESIRSRLGVATFADVVRLLRGTNNALLRQDIWFRLDARVQHLMLDEFQDTSLAQWKVLQPLAEEIVSDGSGERSFFCVGDVKQSIYGWRGGLPGILEHLDRMIRPDGAPVALSDTLLARSYRSSPEVLEAVNLVFGSLSSNAALDGDERPAAESLASQWDPHEAARTDLPGCVELHAFETRGCNAAEVTQLAAEEAARLAASLHAACPGRSIGVLAPRNDTVGSVVARLRAMGIEATGEGGGSFLDCGATVVMLDALHLASHPAARAAAFNVRSSPLGDLLGLQDRGDAVEVSRAMRRAFAARGIARTLEAWEVALAGQLDRRETARVQRLVVEVDRLEQAGELEPARLARLLERTRLDEPGDDAIRVMTIHKSKGLEFDLVIMTGLEGKLFSTPSLAWERPLPPGDIQRVFRWTNEVLRPPIVEPLHDTARLELIRERLCQLYVAMTRARSGLFMLVGSPPKAGKKDAASMAGVLRCALTGIGLEPSAEAPPDVGLLARLGNRRALTANGAAASSDHGVSQPELGLMPKIVIDAESRDRPAPAVPPSGAARSAHPVELLAPDARKAALVGTAWHHLMEQVEWIESWGDSDKHDDQALERLLGDRMPETSEAWRRERIRAFRSSLEHPEIRGVLSNTVFGRETPVCVRREWRWLGSGPGGAPQEGVIDRVVIEMMKTESTRKALIIDWKTDQVPPGGHAEHAERYREQMGRYRAAVADLEGLDPDQVATRLVFLRDGTSVELDLEADQKRISD